MGVSSKRHGARYLFVMAICCSMPSAYADEATRVSECRVQKNVGLDAPANMNCMTLQVFVECYPQAKCKGGVDYTAHLTQWKNICQYPTSNEYDRICGQSVPREPSRGAVYGTVIGIVLGAFFVVFCIATVAFLYYRRHASSALPVVNMPGYANPLSLPGPSIAAPLLPYPGFTPASNFLNSPYGISPQQVCPGEFCGVSPPQGPQHAGPFLPPFYQPYLRR